MKAFCVLTAGVLALAAGCGTTVRSDEPKVLAATPAEVNASSSGDAGTDLVVAFYSALLQKDPPTLEQEQSLFDPRPGLSERLVIGGQGKEGGPVILEFLRKHKELFLPKPMRLDDVGVSSTFHWVRNLDHMCEAPQKGSGYVLAWFLEDRAAEPDKGRFRTIVFSLNNGKIEPDSISLDGYGNNPTLDEFLKVKVKGESDWRFNQ